MAIYPVSQYSDWRSWVFFFAVILLLASGVLAGNGFQQFDWILVLTDEDRWLETLQASGYFAGFAICAIGLFTSHRKAFFLIWAVLTLFFWGEETSWGQRIFDYEVAAVQEHNLQDEFNIHNLGIFNTGGLTSAENWQELFKALLDIQFIFQVCFFIYFAVMPVVLYFSRPLKQIAERLQYIAPSPQLVVLFTVSFVATYVAVLSVDTELYKNAIVEIRETIFGIVVPVYLYQVLITYKSA